MPRVVNKAAFRVLDALFPLGAFSRRAVSLLFRLWLHPGPPVRSHAHCSHTVPLHTARQIPLVPLLLCAGGVEFVRLNINLIRHGCCHR